MWENDKNLSLRTTIMVEVDLDFFTHIKSDQETVWYDQAAKKPLFVMPRGRTFDDFKEEAMEAGYPRFNRQEVIWENVRTLQLGRIVTLKSDSSSSRPDAKKYMVCLTSLCSSRMDNENNQPKDDSIAFAYDNPRTQKTFFGATIFRPFVMKTTNLMISDHRL